MKILIAGGTGFVGQGLAQVLVASGHEVVSLSRRPSVQDLCPGVTYLQRDLSRPGDWQAQLVDTDWVINAVGILWANPLKNQSYRTHSEEPAQALLATLEPYPQVKYLYISANRVPFFLRAYLRSKRSVEALSRRLLGQRAFVVYPGLIYGPERPSTFWLGLLGQAVQRWPFYSSYRLMSRDQFSQEILCLIEGRGTFLQERI